MKTLKVVLLGSLTVINSLKAQNLQTIKTYFDPFTKTQLEEVYTVIGNTPTKQGSYKRYDKRGTLVEEATLIKNEINGTHKTFYGSEWNLPTDYLVGKIHIIETYNNGVKAGLSEQYQYINGKQFYLWQRTYQNGEVVAETDYYSNGNKASSVQVNGLCNEWYESGQKSSEFTNKNKEKDGQFTSWYEDGKLMSKATFSAGNAVGKTVFYFPNGKIQTEKEYNNNSILVRAKEYFSDGRVKYEKYALEGNKYKEIANDSLSGKNLFNIDMLLVDEMTTPKLLLHGTRLIYYPSGNKQAEEHYNMGDPDGQFNHWYENGNIKQAGGYSGNKKSGKWTSYYENGKTKEEGAYSADTKTGKWISFYSDENKEHEINYTNGKKQGEEVFYFAGGKIKSKGSYADDQAVYPWTYYNENGSVDRVLETGPFGTVQSLSGEEVKIKKTKQEIESGSVELKEKQNKIIALYEVKEVDKNGGFGNSLLNTIANEPGQNQATTKVLKAGKKHRLYDAYMIFDNSLVNQNAVSQDEKLQILKTRILLSEKLIVLISEDTQSIEKELKGENDPERIKKILAL